MKKKSIIMMLLMGIILGACTPGFFANLTNEQVAQTAAAQTLAALSTRQYVDTLVAELTQIEEEKEITATSFTPTLTETATPSSTATETPIPPTQTPTPSATPTLTPTATPLPCNWAQFISDISIPDGSFVTAGTTFTKTWRLRNIGACTWTPDYDLVFVSGNAMSGPAVASLDATVSPGDIADVSVRLVAPATAGYYIGYWELRSTQGEIFGLGKNKNQSFWVAIEVPSNLQPFYPDSPLDFSASYLSATWRSSSGNVSINATDNYVNGSVYLTTSPHMEKNYVDNEPALIMIPSDGNGGYIYGEYPGVNIQSGDRFDGIIGCTSDQPDCDVMFQINYSADGGATQNLGSWAEVYDGNWTTLNIDLSFLVGKNVKFTLLVLNNGSSKDDRVFWLAPRILR